MISDLLGRVNFPPPGTEVDLAVSGGPDSLALLVLAAEAGLRARVAHVDHAIRPGSGRDFAIVADVASRYGFDAVCHRVVVEPGPNLEARARAARRSVLPPGHMTGHTADDQSETVLLAVLRGAGPWGLAGMAADETHPLLRIRRTETRAVCDAVGLKPVDDESNRDPAFRRNRVRHELIPLLDDIAGRDCVPVLARIAAHQRELSQELDRAAREIDPTNSAVVRSLASPLFAAVMRSWWRAETGQEHTPDAAALERMHQVAAGTAPRHDVIDGWEIARTGGVLRLVRRTPLVNKQPRLAQAPSLPPMGG